MTEIIEINDDRIKLYRTLRFTPKEHIFSRSFIAEGEKVFSKLLDSDIDIISIFATRQLIDKFQPEIQKREIKEDSIFSASKELMKEIVGFNLHSGIMAMGRIPDDVEPGKLTPPVIIMNGIANAENVGSIIRNAAAFGFSSVISDERSASPWLRRSVRVSMGNIFGFKVHHSEKIGRTIDQMRADGYKIYSAEITDNSQSLYDIKLDSERYCIIFGSEGHGIEKEILEKSDIIVYIPVSEQVSSLNVASSSALILGNLSRLL